MYSAHVNPTCLMQVYDLLPHRKITSHYRAIVASSNTPIRPLLLEEEHRELETLYSGDILPLQQQRTETAQRKAKTQGAVEITHGCAAFSGGAKQMSSRF